MVTPVSRRTRSISSPPLAAERSAWVATARTALAPYARASATCRRMVEHAHSMRAALMVPIVETSAPRRTKSASSARRSISVRRLTMRATVICTVLLPTSSAARRGAASLPSFFALAFFPLVIASCLWVARSDVDGALALIDDHTRPAALHVAHVALLGVIYRHAAGGARLAVVRGERGGLAQRGVWDVAAARLDDDMRARHAARMQPEVVRAGLAEGDDFILAAVFADEQREAVGRLPAQRCEIGRASCRER